MSSFDRVPCPESGPDIDWFQVEADRYFDSVDINFGREHQDDMYDCIVIDCPDKVDILIKQLQYARDVVWEKKK